MIFYEIEAKAEKSYLPKERTKRASATDQIQNATEFFNGKLPGKKRIYISNIHNQNITLAGCLDVYDPEDMEETAASFLNEINFRATDISVKEITILRFIGLLINASGYDFIRDDDEELDKLGIENLRRYEGVDCLTEYVCDEVSSEERQIEASKSLICFPEIHDELKRIRASEPAEGICIHPVHYVIMADDEEQRKKLRDFLVGSLFLSHRLSSHRICIIGSKLNDYGDFNANTEAIFKQQEGSTVVIQMLADSHSERVLDNNHQAMKQLCRCLRKSHKNTLGIIEIGGSNDKFLDQIKMELPNIRLVEFREKALAVDKARDYLVGLAVGDKIVANEDVRQTIPDGNHKYFPSELKDIYEKWLDRYVCEKIYPQYVDMKLNGDSSGKRVEGDAYSRLMEMVGLSEAKKVLKNAIDFHKAQKRYEEFGLNPKETSKHMVFTGNPGSAKTTVARLFAQIMKDNEILKEGVFIEAGRQDIVDMYLGGTAPRVHRLFENAKGGVLFIDEAYSLVDGHRGLYGDEAINTIVQEMENHRDDVIVIFAGYPDKMKVFLDSNPGLRSRIAFHVHFDDYDTDELYQILQLFAKDQKMELAPEVESKLKGFFDCARTYADFGNGRFVRNLFEQAQMRQAGRIVSTNYSKLSRSYISTLVADDFEMPKEYSAMNLPSVIGFRG